MPFVYVVLLLTVCACTTIAGLDELRFGEGGSPGLGGTTSAPAGGGGAGGEGSVGGGGGGAPRCGGLGALRDDFEDGVISVRWTVDTDGDAVAINEDSGAGWLRMSSNAPATGRFESLALVDARERVVALELDASDNSQAVPRFVLRRDEANQALFERLQDGTLRVAIETSGVVIEETVPYDLAAHRFWRFRSDTGNVHLEVSGDGTSFTPLLQRSIDEVFAFDAVFLRLEAEFLSPGQLNFMGILGDPEPFCEVSTFSDDFDDGIEDPTWGRSADSGDCMRREAEGSLIFEGVANGPEPCRYETVRMFDLHDDAATIEYALANASCGGCGGGARLRVGTPTASVSLGHEGDQFVALGWTAGSTNQNLKVDAFFEEQHRFFRLRGEEGVLHVESSSDGTTFESVVTANPSPIALDAVLVSIEASGDVRFDNYNTAP